jgi:hypothetical protein
MCGNTAERTLHFAQGSKLTLEEGDWIFVFKRLVVQEK